MVCIDDEIPFDIPQNWTWCRISSLFLHASGKQQSSNNSNKGTLQKFITTSNLYWGHFVLDKVKEMYFTDEELKTCSATKGDLLVCEGGAGYGRSAIWNMDYEICLQNHVHRLRPIISGLCEYVLYFIYYLKESNQLASVGTAMPGLSANRLKGLLLPLPPLAEQRRIVERIMKIDPLLERYSHSQESIDLLNNNLKERLKKSILQVAIQGQLVSQDPDDEPVSTLLQSINEEKLRLVKEGKLKKKDIVNSVIFKGDDNKYYEKINGITHDISEEIPYDIPDSWCWARIKTLYQTTSGGTPEKGHPEYYGGDIPWVKVGDLTNIYINEVSDYITRQGLENSSAKIFPKGTILIAMYCNDAIGKSSIIQSPMSTNQAICGLFPNTLLYKEYIYFAIQSNRKRLQEQAAGGAQKNINQKTVNELLLPIPPYEEQKRIVKRLIDIIEKMKE